MVHRTVMASASVPSEEEAAEKMRYSVEELRAAAEEFFAERATYLRESTLTTDRNKLNLFFQFLERTG